MECALCKSNVSNSKWRKKLHGSSCKAAREILSLEMGGLSLQDFSQTKYEYAFLCYLCEKLLIGISTLQEKLLIAKEDVAKKVSNLQRIKRPSESEIPSPPAKRQACNRPLIQPPSLQQQPSLPAASSSSAGRTDTDSPNVKVKVIVATNFNTFCLLLFLFVFTSCRLLFHKRIKTYDIISKPRPESSRYGS